MSRDSALTVVTAFYPLRGKHSPDAYLGWMTTFLASVRVPVVAFVPSQEWRDRLTGLREEHAPDAPLRAHILPSERFWAWQQPVDWDLQYSMDREASIHSQDLYAIWHEKPHFVGRAIAENFFGSRVFVWSDIGLPRDPETARCFAEWDADRMVASLDDDRIHLLQLQPFRVRERLTALGGGLPDLAGSVRLGGGMIAGNSTAWRRWTEAVGSAFERLHKNGRFVGKDQEVMGVAALCAPGVVERWAPLYSASGGNPWRWLVREFHQFPDVRILRRPRRAARLLLKRPLVNLVQPIRLYLRARTSGRTSP